ncbi:NinE family protein [Escherichia coli]|nr:NinE family protein [Escherichia coli]HAY0363198.1 NinE family protein [Escherichia coli]
MKRCFFRGFNYTAHLWDIRWLRHRARKTR